jgi:hypothetical protein
MVARNPKPGTGDTRIKAIWAWTAERRGRELLVCTKTRKGALFPLFRLTRARALALKNEAQRFANQEGVDVRLVKFTAGATVRVLHPRGNSSPRTDTKGA